MRQSKKEKTQTSEHLFLRLKGMLINMIIQFSKGDIIQMKKAHPCGSAMFRVLRTGSDIRIRCEGCGRDLTIPRIKLEKNVKKIQTNTKPEA